MDGTKSLSELLAYVLVAAMAAAMSLPFVAPVFRRWAGAVRASRLRAVVFAAMLLGLVYMGGSLDKQQHLVPFTPESFFGGQPSLRTEEPPSHPQWYLDSGYPTADSDGDGIPDIWERWTHTNPAAADSGADPDLDGVDNAEEFQWKCDPAKADTDGDGIDDRTEIDGLLAGVPGLDPLSPATYVAEEPDADGDGIPDIWGDPTQYVVFEDLDGDGFCDALEDVYWGLDCGAEVLFHVWSSRSCALETGVGAPIFLPPCTNLAVRAYIPTDCDTEARLLGAPDGSATVGTWKARLSAEWPPAPGVAIERDRICAADGSIIDMTPPYAVFAGILGGAEPQGASGGLRSGSPSPSARNSTVIWFRRKTIELSVSPFCREHGPGPVVTATLTGIEPPLHWEIENTPVAEDGGLTFSPQSASWDGDVCEVRCSKLDRHTNVVLSATLAFSPQHCIPSVTNIVGAGWTSTHNPTNAADHAPGVEVSYEHFTEDCPVTTNVTVRAGWTHNTAILWIRNLVRILTGDPWDDETDHCIALDWSSGLVINFDDYLSSETVPLKLLLFYKVNGQESAASLSVGGAPSPFHPRVYHVELCLRETGQTLDRMWVVVNNSDIAIDFLKWYVANSSDVSWAFRLPKPYASLTLSTNFFGRITADDPEPGTPSQWTSPDRVGSFLHHNARWEMRAYGNSEGHGNQACYDAGGQLIRSGIAGGTADFSPGFVWTVQSHIVNDVNPFLHAVHLDGNPGDTTSANDVSRPCLHQGNYIDQYIFCRPITQP